MGFCVSDSVEDRQVIVLKPGEARPEGNLHQSYRNPFANFS
jgi:hypothetical protein